MFYIYSLELGLCKQRTTTHTTTETMYYIFFVQTYENESIVLSKSDTIYFSLPLTDTNVSQLSY